MLRAGCFGLVGREFVVTRHLLSAALNLSIESSPPSPVKDPRNAILESGFFIAKEPVIGQNIKRIDEDAIPFTSANGLYFCKANILDNPVS